MTTQRIAVATPAPTPDRIRGIARWKRGHHVFHVYLTAMNSLLDESVALLADHEWSRLEARLQQLTTLYDASTAGMRYAADFAREDYASVVRPSMEPPFMSPGFSGVMNREHREMLAGMRRLRAAVRDRPAPMPGAVADAWAELQEAQRRNRANHELVCRRFVADGVSLLRQFHQKRRAHEQATGEEDGDGDGRGAVASGARAGA
jgi:hypothetical protein